LVLRGEVTAGPGMARVDMSAARIAVLAGSGNELEGRPERPPLWDGSFRADSGKSSYGVVIPAQEGNGAQVEICGAVPRRATSSTQAEIWAMAVRFVREYNCLCLGAAKRDSRWPRRRRSSYRRAADWTRDGTDATARQRRSSKSRPEREGTETQMWRCQAGCSPSTPSHPCP
jgi:hypothetical protein